MAPCNQPGCGKIRCSSHFASIPKPTGAGSTSVRQCMHCSFAVHSLTDDHELNHVIAVEAIHQRIYLCTARNIPEVDFGSSISDTIDRLAALKQRLQNGRVSASSAFSQEECVLVNQFLRPRTPLQCTLNIMQDSTKPRSPSGVRPYFRNGHTKFVMTIRNTEEEGDDSMIPLARCPPPHSLPGLYIWHGTARRRVTKIRARLCFLFF